MCVCKITTGFWKKKMGKIKQEKRLMVLPLLHLIFCQDFFLFYYLIKSRSHNKEICETYAPQHIIGYN